MNRSVLPGENTGLLNTPQMASTTSALPDCGVDQINSLAWRSLPIADRASAAWVVIVALRRVVPKTSANDVTTCSAEIGRTRQNSIDARNRTASAFLANAIGWLRHSVSERLGGPEA
jgi:hypothetical protein